MRRKSPRLTVCVGCGCDDQHACTDLLEEPCRWLATTADKRTGVCSHCKSYLWEFSKGNTSLSARARAAVSSRQIVERAIRAATRSSHRRH